MKQLITLARVVPLASLCALSIACTGILDGGSNKPSGQDPSNPSTNPPATAGTAGSASSVTSGGGPAAVDTSDPFKVNNTRPELVPFQMRLRRIAAAVGVPTEHAMFDGMRKNSLKLGDYDYANGALPDGSWNANRIAAWMTMLKPICNSAEFKAKYPALPENLPQLLRAAWGHLPSAEDSADFQTALAASTDDAQVKYESTCMAVFSAAEFVYR